MEVDIIITLSIAAFLIFLIAQVGRVVRNNVFHKTIRRAIEKDQQMTPELIEQFDRPAEPGAIDQRIGFVLIALALALFAAAIIEPGDDGWKELLMIGLFPLFVGSALLLRLRLSRRVEP